MRRAAAMLALLALLLAAGCGGGGYVGSPPGGTPGTTGAETVASRLPVRPVVIKTSGGEKVEVTAEIADDKAERRKGLMGRTELAENAGMLFVYKREQPRSFWMKDTLIPLSIAFIAADGRIVDIQDMKPLDTTSHPSAEPAKYALEVNQGFFEKRGIRVGDRVEIPPNL
jgi:uncharacterized membrane protein (UPF0127 family)